jgi:Domain of unknown function (DUF4338)/DDE_Tnp_1-associated/Transposase DDE domain
MTSSAKRIFPNAQQQAVLQSVRVRLLEAAELARWNELIEKHHYLRDATLVGEVLRYVAHDEHGEWLALLGYSSASFHLRVRDEWLGWTGAQREKRRQLITQNSRFLILPHVHCPNLASRLLKLVAQRLRDDFPRVHGHPVVLVETFVDPEHYRGACYQAANWLPLGRTAGWARAGRDYYQKHDRPKEVWVQALYPQAAQWLKAQTMPADLAAAERIPPPRNHLDVPALGSLIEAFGRLPDARRRAGRRHRLDAVMTLAAAGVLAGARTLADLAAIAAELNQPQLRAVGSWLNAKTGRREPPSESTFQRALSQIEGDLLDQVLGQWLLAQDPAHPQLCVDGKAVKGTKDLHLFSAFCGQTEKVVAQIAVPEKTNEIPMLPKLLEGLPIEGALISADALHTQSDTARHLVQERGADYLFVAKNNQPSLREQCARLFPEPVFSP